MPDNPINPPVWERHNVIDYGTKNLSVATQIVQQGSKPDPSQARILPLQNPIKEEVPQKVGFFRDGGEWRFVWGWDLENILRSNAIEEEDIVVFEWLKMCSYGASEAADLEGSIEARLSQIGFHGKGVSWLHTLHLNRIHVAMHTAARSLWPNLSPQEFDDMHVVNFIAVPEIADPNTCRSMMQAAKAAGFVNAHPISETEAAGAWAVHKLLANRPDALNQADLEDGDEMVVADAGGLTLNASAYRTAGSISDGYDIAMDTTGRNAGDRCGSETLTWRCIKHAKDYCAKHYGEDFLLRLGISETAFEMSVARNFEGYKLGFSGGSMLFCVMVSGSRIVQHHSPLRQAAIIVEGAEMLQWFEETYVKMRTVIDSIMSPKVKWMVLTGGFMRNEYIRQRLEEDYHDAKGIQIIDGATNTKAYDLSVVKGWLARASVRKTQVPMKFGWGIVQEEWWNAKIHVDAPEGSDLIRTGEYRSGKYVADRWKWLLHPGSLVAEGQVMVATAAWQEYYVTRDEPYLEQQIYWTDLSLQDHVDVYPNGDIMSGVHEWDEEHRQQIPIEILEQYPVVFPQSPEATTKACRQTSKAPKGTPKTPKSRPHLDEDARHVVWARIKLRVRGLDVKASWEIAPKGFKPYKARGHAFRAPPEPNLLHIGEASLNEQNFGSFLQRSSKPAALVPADAEHPTHKSTLPMPASSHIPPSPARSSDPGDQISDLNDSVADFINEMERDIWDPLLAEDERNAETKVPGRLPGVADEQRSRRRSRAKTPPKRSRPHEGPSLQPSKLPKIDRRKVGGLHFPPQQRKL